MFGNQLMYPKYLLSDNDIVFVSMNYRLGILGENKEFSKFPSITHHI